jgi:nitric oxide reductase subunit B
MQYTRLWIALAVVIIGSFAVLGGVGMRAVRQAPPIPQQVVSAEGSGMVRRSTGQGVSEGYHGPAADTVSDAWAICQVFGDPWDEQSIYPGLFLLV